MVECQKQAAKKLTWLLGFLHLIISKDQYKSANHSKCWIKSGFLEGF